MCDVGGSHKLKTLGQNWRFIAAVEKVHHKCARGWLVCALSNSFRNDNTLYCLNLHIYFYNLHILNSPYIHVWMDIHNHWMMNNYTNKILLLPTTNRNLKIEKNIYILYFIISIRQQYTYLFACFQIWMLMLYICVSFKSSLINFIRSSTTLNVMQILYIWMYITSDSYTLWIHQHNIPQIFSRMDISVIRSENGSS